jgi:prophage regulatory protein
MNNSQHVSLVRRPQVEAMTGLKRSSIYARLNPTAKQFDPEFPKPVSLSTGGKGSVAWIASEVIVWIERRIAVSRTSGN